MIENGNIKDFTSAQDGSCFVVGGFVKDSFYYVANSLLSRYNEQHQLKPIEQLQDVVILKADLLRVK